MSSRRFDLEVLRDVLYTCITEDDTKWRVPKLPGYVRLFLFFLRVSILSLKLLCHIDIGSSSRPNKKRQE